MKSKISIVASASRDLPKSHVNGIARALSRNAAVSEKTKNSVVGNQRQSQKRKRVQSV